MRRLRSGVSGSLKTEHAGCQRRGREREGRQWQAGLRKNGTLCVRLRPPGAAGAAAVVKVVTGTPVPDSRSLPKGRQGPGRAKTPSRKTTAGPRRASWRPGTRGTRAPSPASLCSPPVLCPSAPRGALAQPPRPPQSHSRPRRHRPPPRHLDSAALLSSLARSCESAPETVSVAVPNSQTPISAHAGHQYPLSARTASLPAHSVRLGAHSKVTGSPCGATGARGNLALATSTPELWSPAHGLRPGEASPPSHRHAPLSTPRSGEKQKMLTVLGPEKKCITWQSSKAT